MMFLFFKIYFFAIKGAISKKNMRINIKMNNSISLLGILFFLVLLLLSLLFIAFPTELKKVCFILYELLIYLFINYEIFFNSIDKEFIIHVIENCYVNLSYKEKTRKIYLYIFLFKVIETTILLIPIWSTLLVQPNKYIFFQTILIVVVISLHYCIQLFFQIFYILKKHKFLKKNVMLFIQIVSLYIIYLADNIRLGLDINKYMHLLSKIKYFLLENIKSTWNEIFLITLGIAIVTILAVVFILFIELKNVDYKFQNYDKYLFPIFCGLFFYIKKYTLQSSSHIDLCIFFYTYVIFFLYEKIESIYQVYNRFSYIKVSNLFLRDFNLTFMFLFIFLIFKIDFIHFSLMYFLLLISSPIITFQIIMFFKIIIKHLILNKYLQRLVLFFCTNAALIGEYILLKEVFLWKLL